MIGCKDRASKLCMDGQRRVESALKLFLFHFEGALELDGKNPVRHDINLISSVR